MATSSRLRVGAATRFGLTAALGPAVPERLAHEIGGRASYYTHIAALVTPAEAPLSRGRAIALSEGRGQQPFIALTQVHAVFKGHGVTGVRRAAANGNQTALSDRIAAGLSPSCNRGAITGVVHILSSIPVHPFDVHVSAYLHSNSTIRGMGIFYRVRIDICHTLFGVTEFRR